MIQQCVFLHSIWPNDKSHGPPSKINDSFAFEQDEKPKVEPLREEHFDRLDETLELAFKDNPMKCYLRDTPDARKPSRAQQRLRKLLWKKYMKLSIELKPAYTVGAGYSVIESLTPKKDVGRVNPIRRLFLVTVMNVYKLISKLNSSPEQRRRQQELTRKIKALDSAHIPEDVAKEMVFVEILATHPEHRGRGYASALLKTALFSADIHGCAVYLHTSNPANIGFYGLFGFEDVGGVLLGSDNPSWKGPPIRFALMVRKANAVEK